MKISFDDCLKYLFCVPSNERLIGICGMIKANLQNTTNKPLNYDETNAALTRFYYFYYKCKQQQYAAMKLIVR